MSSSLYEIVELTNGDVALRRINTEDDSETLVSIKFSEESIFFLGEAKLDVAKAMIEAGLDTVSEIVEPVDSDTESDVADLDLPPAIVH